MGKPRDYASMTFGIGATPMRFASKSWTDSVSRVCTARTALSDFWCPSPRRSRPDNLLATVCPLLHPFHLPRRFFRSVRREGPSATDETWATEQLLPAERDLWFDMSGRDRRHAIVVTKQVAVTLGPHGTRPMITAALLQRCTHATVMQIGQSQHMRFTIFS